MRNIHEDSLTGIIIAAGICGNRIESLIVPDTTIGTVAPVFLVLLTIRFIRMWREKEFRPASKWLPLLKFTDSVLWFIVAILWWNEANGDNDFIGIGLMLLLMVYASKELYEAIKLLIRSSRLKE